MKNEQTSKGPFDSRSCVDPVQNIPNPIQIIPINTNPTMITLPSFSSFNYLINPLFNVKLDDINYLIWKEQLKHVITMYGLESFVDEIVSPLPKFVKTIELINKEIGVTSTINMRKIQRMKIRTRRL